MKLYKLSYNGVVVGARLCEIPSCKYSLDMDLDLAKELLNLIDKRRILKGGTLPLKIVGDMYVTDNEENVITASSLNECLKYVNNTKEVLGKYVNIYVSQRLEEMMPNILQGTNLGYEDRRVRLCSYEYGDYKYLFINDKNNKDKRTYQSRDYGITLEVKYSRKHRKLKVTAEVVVVESRTIHYVNAMPETFYNFLHTDDLSSFYDKCIKFDGKKVIDKDIVDVKVLDEDIIDIRDIDNRGNLTENTKHYYTDKPDFILLKRKRNHTVITPTYYFDSLFDPIFEEIIQMYKGNMQKIESKLSSKSDILNYLGSFKTVSKLDLIELSKMYPKCYYYNGDRTPHFDNLSNTEDHIKEMEEKYGVILGFRRYLIFEGNLYLWFDEDENVDMWC